MGRRACSLPRSGRTVRGRPPRRPGGGDPPEGAARARASAAEVPAGARASATPRGAVVGRDGQPERPVASRCLPAPVQSVPAAGPPDQWKHWRRRGGARVAAPAGPLCARAARGAEGCHGLHWPRGVSPAPVRAEAPGQSLAPDRGRRAPRDTGTPVWGGGRAAAPPTPRSR